MRININFPIMVLFLTLTRNTLFLWRLNAYRLYLQVITITDITNPVGTQIEWSVLNIIPTRTKQSNPSWSNRHRLNKESWSLRRKPLKDLLQYNDLTFKLHLARTLERWSIPLSKRHRINHFLYFKSPQDILI